MKPNTLGAALKNKIGKAADYLTGTTRINNDTNPASAAYKMRQSIGKPNPRDPRNFKSTLPKQQIYGVPGITKNSQLPK